MFTRMRLVAMANALTLGASALAVGCSAPPPTASSAPAIAPATATAPVPTATPLGPRSRATVTLITGDRVHLTTLAGDRHGVTIDAAPGRAHVAFFERRYPQGKSEDIVIMPADAMALVASGRLDRTLFNVTELVRQGFDDARGATLPLLVTHAGSGLRAMTSAAPSARVTRALPSIAGAALVLDKRDAGVLWRALAPATPSGARAVAPAFADAATRVWLDARAHVVLDQSVPQIGAPTAWAMGLTGKGVTVAVLDTGIELDHPDLQARIIAARDFTNSAPDGSDDVGHGTHVAGIIVGSGAASQGRYSGVAPDASLIDAKGES